MQFVFENPVNKRSRIKATAQRSGKLGFSSGAADFMKLSVEKYFKVATNAENPDDRNLYLISSQKEDEQAFKVNKAGQYFYLSVKHVFDKHEYPYEEERIIFDIKEKRVGEMIYYELKERKPINRG